MGDGKMRNAMTLHGDNDGGNVVFDLCLGFAEAGSTHYMNVDLNYNWNECT